MIHKWWLLWSSQVCTLLLWGRAANMTVTTSPPITALQYQHYDRENSFLLRDNLWIMKWVSVCERERERERVCLHDTARHYIGTPAHFVVSCSSKLHGVCDGVGCGCQCGSGGGSHVKNEDTFRSTRYTHTHTHKHTPNTSSRGVSICLTVFDRWSPKWLYMEI